MYIKVAIFALFLVAVTYAEEYSIAEDKEGQQFFMIPVPLPLHRQKRGSTVDLKKDGDGGLLYLSHQGTIYNNGNHRLDGRGFVSKPFKPNGPATVGGNLGYSHIPSGSNVNLAAQHTRGFGTNVQAEGRGNLWRNGNTRLDAVGSYGRQFGGPGGTGRPNAYGGIQFEHKF